MTVVARPAILLLPVIYLGFISLGLPDGTLGVAWPRMHPELALPIGLAGTLLLLGTALSAVSSFASGAILGRFKVGPVVMVSGALTGAGLLLIAHARGAGWLFLAMVPLGLGAGAVDAGLNGYVARHYGGRHMSWLHACWGVGATVGPLVVTSSLDGAGGWRGGFLAIALAQLALALVFAATLRLWARAPERRDPAGVDSGGRAAPTTRADSRAGFFAVLTFGLYVGVEATTGLWASSILVTGRGIDPTAAGLCATGYYGAIMAGRLLFGFVVERVGNRRLVALGAGLALVGALGFAFAATAGAAGLALALVGLGFAPIYPCLMHEAPRRFAPGEALIVIGRQSSASFVGGALAPALAGWLAQQAGVNSIPWMVVAGVLAMAATIRRVDRLT